MRVHTARELGLLIRERRRELGLTQAQLAGTIGASRKWVIDLETGNRVNDLKLMLRALNALGLSLDASPQPKLGGPTDIDAIVAASLERR